MNRRLLALVCALLLPNLALAHAGNSGQAHGFWQGFSHPLLGIDHLAAMLAVGLWSGLALRRPWLAPLSFAAMLMVGACSGVSGTWVEPLVALSVLLLGLFATLRLRLSALFAAVLVGGFSLAHGMAHGAELVSGVAVLGLLACTGLLHTVGLAVGLCLRDQETAWSRLLGAGIALLGLGLLGQGLAA